MGSVYLGKFRAFWVFLYLVENEKKIELEKRLIECGGCFIDCEENMSSIEDEITNEIKILVLLQNMFR